MLCKYYLKLGSTTIGSDTDDCLDVSNYIKNLEAIKVSYTRSDLGGVVRKCGSEIEFTGKAYDRILDYFAENYLQSCGCFAVFVADNNWKYSNLWECPLDFSTLQYDGNVATMGCVDNGAAAIIKANGKSKYEYAVADLAESTKLVYNGVVTKRVFNFNIVGASPQGESTTDMVSSKDVTVTRKGYYSLWVPAIGINTESYSSEKFSIMDQSEDATWSVAASGQNDGVLMNSMMENDRAGFVRCVVDGTLHIDIDLHFGFAYPSWMALRGFTCYFILVAGENVVYRQEVTDYINGVDVSIHQDIEMAAGEKLGFGMSILSKITNWSGTIMPDGSKNENTYLIFNPILRWPSNTQSSYVNESGSQEEPINLSVIKPLTLLQKLLDSMFEGLDAAHVVGEITNGSNTVLDNTMLLAAESARQLASPNIYSTFNDFAETMESVFGYVYTIDDYGYMMLKELEAVKNGEAEKITHICVDKLSNETYQTTTYHRYLDILPLGDVIEDDISESLNTEDVFSYEGGEHWDDIIFYAAAHNVFVMKDPDTGTYYTHFINPNWSYRIPIQSSLYNDGNQAKELLGVTTMFWQIFAVQYAVVYNGQLVFCDSLHNRDWFDEDINTMPITKVTFIHRNEVFSSEVVKELGNSNNLAYQFDEAKVYSAVEVGYTKKDYKNSNSGKNEFNFTNYYNTDTTLKDNTLSLISPYRADCYGIEELLVTNSDSESTSSDDDIFLVVTKTADDGSYVLDRDTTVEHAYTDTVFNANLAPNIIVRNNEAYIGAFAKLLTFTSSDANSEAVIGEHPMSENIAITSQTFKVGKIAIDTGDLTLPSSWDGIITFEYHGKTYKGYLESVDINFAQMGTLTYNLIEKCIE